MSLAFDSHIKPILPIVAPLTAKLSPLGEPLVRIATGLLLIALVMYARGPSEIT